MAEKLILQGFELFAGKHCETTALKRVLDYHGLSLSEEMLFGLGGGIGFVYWHTKRMTSPFIGARYGKGNDFVFNICQRIGAKVTIIETSSPKRAYEELKRLLRDDEPAVLYVDMVYLPYLALPEQAHFGGHVIVVVGLDEERGQVYIYDRARNPVTASVGDLVRARSSKFPPFPPKHRLLKIRYPARIQNLAEGIKASICECCEYMLRPPIRNIGIPGMGKWSRLVVEWPRRFQGASLLGALMDGFIYIEIGGTGGSAFRPMYAKFLEEAGDIINKPALKEIATMMRESARIWSEIAEGLLPNSLPSLAKIRQLMFEKNKEFEDQKPDVQNEMTRINNELDALMEEATEDLRRPLTFLADVGQNIARCSEIERKAFDKLSGILAE